MKRKVINRVLALMLVGAMATQSSIPYLTSVDVFGAENTKEKTAYSADTVVIDVTDFGADENGIVDSTVAVQQALDAAKEASKDGSVPVVLNFPKGEYQFYADHAFQREFHTSNTNSIQNPIKTINILIEGHKNLTVEGNGSLFMMHGMTMALAVVKSENVKLQNFSWDYAAATNSEMTILEMGTDDTGKKYTDYFIPSNCPYTIKGTNIEWNGGLSPETGKFYWTKTNEHGGWTRIGYHPLTGVIRRYSTSPFTVGRSSITKLDNNTVRITYSGERPAPETIGFTWEFCASPTRQTAGAFIWESKDTVVERVNVHFLNQFGWLTQMSENVTFRECNFMPRAETGRLCTSYADLIHVSGAKGKVTIENNNFSHALDDPINIHGTFTRVVSKLAPNQLELEYVEAQQGGFQQYYVGDKVVFATRDGLTPLGGTEEIYTVTSVVNPFEGGLGGRRMKVTFDKELPGEITDNVGGNGKRYVAENLSYTPEVVIKGNDFATIPTRGILCTTRKKVVIEDNIFKTQAMQSIFLSNDAKAWYESGPIKDLTIRNNTFVITSSNATGGNATDNQSAICIYPVIVGDGGNAATDQRVHENISIIGNKFYMEKSLVVEATSVKNLTIKDNEIYRKDPNIKINLSSSDTTLNTGESTRLVTQSTGNTLSANLFKIEKCNTVNISGNKLDDGLKYNIENNNSVNINNQQNELKVGNGTVQPAVGKVRYATSDATVATVDASGNVVAKGAGTAKIYAYYEWDGQKIKSNEVTFTVSGETAIEASAVSITNEDNQVIKGVEETIDFDATVSPQEAGAVVWSVVDARTQGETTAATITQDGVLSATGSAIVDVVATVGDVKDTKTVVISLPVGSKVLAQGVSIVNELSNMWEAGADCNSVVLTMQPGDLYGTSNLRGAGVKNLFLFNDFGAKNKNSLRAEIDLSGLPAKSGTALTASFILYKDNDNYVSTGKKGHINGLTTVNEIAGNATEVAGVASDNNITDGRFALEKIGNTVKTYFKATGTTTWREISSVTNASLGTDYKIALAVWAPQGNTNKVTFSNLKVDEIATANTALDSSAVVPLLRPGSALPVAISGVTLDKAQYKVGETATVTRYQVGETENEGAVLFGFKTTNGNVTKKQYTTNPNGIVPSGSNMLVDVYAKDSSGRYAVPGSASASIQSVESYRLSELAINGSKVDGFTPDVTDYTVEVPDGTQKIVLGYASENHNTGVTQIPGVDNVQNSGNYVLNGIADGQVITVNRNNSSGNATSAKTYRITVKYMKESSTKLSNIAIPELSVNDTTCTTESYAYASPSHNKVNLRIKGQEKAKSITVRETYFKKSVVDTNSANNEFSALVKLNAGANIFYVDVTAEDGVTKKTYTITIVGKGESNADLTSLKVDNTSLVDFSSDKTEYELSAPVTKNLVVEAVAAGESAKVEYLLNGIKLNNGTIPFASMQKGMNDIMVKVTAGDTSSVKIYKIKIFVPSQENASLKNITIDGVDFGRGFDPNTSTYNLKAKQSTSKITLSAQEAEANVKITYRGQTLDNKHTVEKPITLYKGDNIITVEVTAPNGTTKKTYTFHITAQEYIYLSDLPIDSEPLIGYEGVKMDKSTGGGKIKLPDAQGNPVTYDKGIGAHANSKVIYDISGMGLKSLTGFVGINYIQFGNAQASSSVTFKILLDEQTTPAFDSGVMEKTTAQKQFNLDVTGVKKITLFADQGANNYNDHADWADVKFVNEFPDAPQTPESANKELLNAKIAEANRKVESEYTSATWAPFKTALEAAKVIAAKTDATQTQVDEALASLIDAMGKLTTKPIVKNGWIEEKEGMRYYENDKVVSFKWVKNNKTNKWTYAGKDGYMSKGWQKVGGGWYYLGTNGIMTTGWQKVNGEWYLLSSSGKMFTGWQKESGTWYLLSNSGKMLTGWQKEGGTWYFLGKSGKMQTGWLKDKGTWYYLAKSGKMATGWVKDAGRWYYMSGQGKMQTGWVFVKGYWYYLNANGAMATGWKKVGTKEYYLNLSSGAWHGQVR